MKIVTNTPDRLVIEDRPWLLWILLPGLGLPGLLMALGGQIDGLFTTLLVGALGAGCIWVAHRFAPFQRITFDRDSNRLVHDLYRLTGHQRWERSLAGIRQAASEGQWSDGARLERVTLLTEQGRHPLESGFSSRRAKPVIDAINAWLDTRP